jgi:dihydroorotase
MSLLIRGGRIIDPATHLDQQADLLILEGRVAQIARGIAQGAAERVIDAKDCWVVPGLVDMHVHLREPGEEHKEDIESGTAAAAAGGFTTVCCMPNTRPVNDGADVTAHIVRRARELQRVRVYPIGAITRRLAGQELADHEEMRDAGAIALSDDGRCVMNARLMRQALEAARRLNLVLIQHCEDHELSQGGAINEGAVSLRTGLSAQPAAAESAIVARDVELLQLSGGRYHVAHISTAAALRQIQQAKALGLAVSCEAAPHHFTLTEEACAAQDTSTKVNPPLRTSQDVEALKQAIAEGIVEVIASDHAPHSSREKDVAYDQAAFGISGIETSLSLSLALWREGVVSLERLLAMMSCNPARILGLDVGTLRLGATADVTVIDPDARWIVDPASFRSKGRNSPFAGQELQGRVKATVVGGELVFRL